MKYLFFWLLFFSTLIKAQEFEYENKVYLDHIRSVRFHIDGLLNSYPILDLNSTGALVLSFDDLDEGSKDFTYSIVHCNQDWTPSILSKMEYMEGFDEEPILDFRYSAKTTIPFTNYNLFLPNEDVSWTKSGNYLLIVYEDADEKQVAFTRRFMVTEPLLPIAPTLVRPAKVSKNRTHQEIDFIVDLQDLRIQNPRVELKATVLQNGRWDIAIESIVPTFIRGQQVVFDYQDKIIFPAGKEFRFLDLRSLYYTNDQILEIQSYEDRHDVILTKDEKRDRQTYLFFEDLNGNYVIETRDRINNTLESDYANVIFSLYSPAPYYDQEVYLLGAFNDWQRSPENKMVYNDRVNGYVAKALLKQGFYNYTYGIYTPSTKRISTSETEGDWYETENDYTILIYYRPFGERFDRILGVSTFTSAP